MASSWNDKPSTVNKFNVNNPIIYTALHVSAIFRGSAVKGTVNDLSEISYTVITIK
jgi:hypothetical protein